MKSEGELRRERRWALIAAAIVALPVVALYATLKFITPRFHVPTESMRPTIHGGDHVFVNRLAYELGEKPKRGDVVGYQAPDGSRMLHRAMAGPGDTIELRHNVLIVNGAPLRERYIIITPEVPAVRTFSPLSIPAGHYFVLGDNRDNANDSRFQGPIAEENIFGRMFYVLHVGRCEE